jgi:hypothetical protein
MLKQVKKNEHLHWPEDMTSVQMRYRGGAGYVVDTDAPCEARFLKGQEHKLEVAADGAKPSKIELATALRLIAAHTKANGAESRSAAAKPLPSVTVPKRTKAAN